MQNIVNRLEELITEYYKCAKQRIEDSQNFAVSLSAPLYDEREAILALQTILEGWISQGPKVRKFEQMFARYIGCSHGIAVNSGSSANLLALTALKEYYSLKPGDEVIIPAATFATVAMPIVQVGLVPVYVDVKRDTLNLDPTEIERSISPKTRVLMPVHTLGYPADMPRIMELARKFSLTVLEDCCEAHGSSINDKKAGSFGAIATFSFFVAHNMTTGEGGMIVTKDESMMKICRSLREFGRYDQQNIDRERFYNDDILHDFDKRYVFDRIGYNVRMTDVTAAFGIEQLKKLDDMNQQRRDNAKFLKQKLMEECGSAFEFPGDQKGYHHTYYTFPILLTEKARFTRRELVEFLEAKKIETRPLFGGCLPDQPAFRGQPGRVVGELTQSRYIRDRLFFIGIHAGLKRLHMEHVVDTIVTFVRKISK